MELEDKDAVGAFVSYDENTGRGTIYPGTYDRYVEIKKERANFLPGMRGPNLPGDPDKRCFFFLVAESQKHQFNFKKGRSVVFDRVSESSMEATHLRF
ncbi:hypothetical protein [Pseudomonas triticicola]|uniref:hypothetical protein n=1 Tax=Pseudomonas triticicola TaxID=2842345 RepID=UPI003EC0D62C